MHLSRYFHQLYRLTMIEVYIISLLCSAIKTGHAPESEATDIAKALFDMLNCNYYELPVEFFTDAFRFRNIPSPYLSTVDYQECVGEKRGTETTRHCMSILKANRECQKISETCGKGIKRYRQCALDSKHKYEYCNKTYLERNQQPFLHHRKCLDKIWTNAVAPCVPVMQASCETSPLRAVKTIRLTIDAIGPLLSLDPKVKVIHLLRDPRGMLLSRMKYLKNTDLLKNSDSACRRILHDISLRKQLELTYQDTFLEVKYEDLATNPLDWLNKIYNHLGLQVTEKLRTWLIQRTHSSSTAINKNKNAITRSNATDTAFAWKSILSAEQRNAVESAASCKELIEILNYS